MDRYLAEQFGWQLDLFERPDVPLQTAGGVHRAPILKSLMKAMAYMIDNTNAFVIMSAWIVSRNVLAVKGLDELRQLREADPRFDGCFPCKLQRAPRRRVRS